MKKLRAPYALLLALALLAGLSVPTQAQQGGDELPSLEGGKSLATASLSEGSTIVVVWASWSPRGRALGKTLERLEARWSDRARVITVNFQERPERARRFVREQGIELPVYLDAKATFAKRHAVTALPFLLVFDEGEKKFSGRLPADVDAVIERSLG